MKVLSIAVNTFRENLRDKLLYNLLIFALLMIGSSLIFMRLTLGEFHRLILDIGLGSINFFGVLIAIFVGIGPWSSSPTSSSSIPPSRSCR